MPKRNIPALFNVESELDKLAHSLAEGVKSFLRYLSFTVRPGAKASAGTEDAIANEAPATHRRGRRPGRRAASRPASRSDRWPWAELMPAAARLLKKNPKRQWHSGEFCKAIKEEVNIDSVRGMHFALIPRLRKDGMIEKSAGGTFRARKARRGGRA